MEECSVLIETTKSAGIQRTDSLLWWCRGFIAEVVVVKCGKKIRRIYFFKNLW